MRKVMAALTGTAIVAVTAVIFNAGENSTLEKRHRVETEHLFSPVYDLSPPPARDLIALQLATQPVVWPQVPIPRAKQNASKLLTQIKQAKKSNRQNKPSSGQRD